MFLSEGQMMEYLPISAGKRAQARNGAWLVKGDMLRVVREATRMARPSRSSRTVSW